MVQFVRKEADILVATTIIESGLDIPNANTIFIDEADIYGLADLHQLRGRVGRSKHRAYAYLIVNPLKMLNPNAQQRLKAIEEFTELGAGFKIAMRDLEIRGAGNILGGGAERAHRGRRLRTVLPAARKRGAAAEAAAAEGRRGGERRPAVAGVPAARLRAGPEAAHRSVPAARAAPRPGEAGRLPPELRDRYGPHPEPVEWLLRTTEIRLLCVKWQVASVHRHDSDLVFTYRNADRAKQLVAASKGRLKIVDEKSIYLRLKASDTDTPEGLYKLLLSVLKP